MTENLIQIPGSQNNNPLMALGAVLKQMEHLAGYLQHLEYGVMSLANELQTEALTTRMVLKILVEKNICTEEEVQGYYIENVEKPIKNMMEEIKKNAQEQEKCTQSTCSCTEQKDCDLNKNEPVLASEKSNVIKFPNEK
jgi:predicted transcriptional regulator